MSKSVVAILAFVTLSQAQAQYPQMGQQGNVVAAPPAATAPSNGRPTVLYDERTNELVEIRPEVAQAAPQQQYQAPAQAQGQTNPIYILNNQKYQGYAGASSQQGLVQDQATTVVQDSPLTNSQADAMRRRRQEAEMGTEDGIVQALERARIEDEMRRRERFNGAIGTGGGDRGGHGHYAPQPPPPPVVHQPQVIQQVVPAPVAAPIVLEDDDDKVDFKSEIRAALREKERDENRQTYYVSGLIGFSKYPDVINVRGDMSGGFAVGMVTPERVVAEGTFMYGTYELEDLYRGYIVDMRQYNLGAAVKYQLLPGRLRPVVGGVINYTRRSFSLDAYDFRTSDAVDGGLVTGLDLQLTDNLALGIDFRYLMNIGFSQNSENRGSFVRNQSFRDVEGLDYYTGSLTGKFTF